MNTYAPPAMSTSSARTSACDVWPVPRVVIEWSDGFDTVLDNVAVNQRLSVAGERPYSHGPLVRGTQGIQSRPAAEKPQVLLQLYDIENCPYCRLVREALTELDLDAEILPCPKGGERFRTEVVERGGKAQFPYLVDPNTGAEMYESLDIIDWLRENAT